MNERSSQHDPNAEGRILSLPFKDRSEVSVNGCDVHFHVDALGLLCGETVMSEIFICRITVVPVGARRPGPPVTTFVNLEIFRNRKLVHGVNLPKKWRKNSRYQLAEDLVNIAGEYVTLQNIKSVHAL